MKQYLKDRHTIIKSLFGYWWPLFYIMMSIMLALIISRSDIYDLWILVVATFAAFFTSKYV